MSVLIKGFDKPKNCRVCDFNSSDCFCKINHGKIDRDFWDCDKECPIFEVSVPHGDLIDRNALIEFCAERWIPLNIDAVNMQPTVIEAEDGDTE